MVMKPSFFSSVAEVDVERVDVGSRLIILLLGCSAEAGRKLIRGCSCPGCMSSVAVCEAAAELGRRVWLGEFAMRKFGLLESVETNDELGANIILLESEVERIKVGQVGRLGTVQLLPT